MVILDDMVVYMRDIRDVVDMVAILQGNNRIKTELCVCVLIVSECHENIRTENIKGRFFCQYIQGRNQMPLVFKNK